jgi:putative ABC transport system permease protein
LVLSSFQPARSLKGDRGVPGNLGARLSKGLVVFQFTISAVFVISSIVVSHQMRHMLNKDLGFNQDAIIRLEADYKDPWERKELLADRMRALPAVAGVSLDMAPPAIDGTSRTTIENKRKEKMAVDIRISDTNYLSLYQLKLIAGRNYFASDTLREIVINTSFAKALGYKRPEEAIGQTLPMWDKNPMIVGVVADFNTRSAQYGVGPAMILDQKGSEFGFDVKLRMAGKTAAEMRQTIDVIEKDWKALFPNEPFRYQWMNEFVKNMYQGAEKTGSLVNLAMIITILVSCMGLFGLAALTAEQRTREIGIRKVLGAGVANIVTMISRDFVLLVAIALMIASPVAWYFLHGWLQGFEYRVGIGWWVFVLAGIGSVATALLAVGFHSLRAALINPVKSLRSE